MCPCSSLAGQPHPNQGAPGLVRDFLKNKVGGNLGRYPTLTSGLYTHIYALMYMYACVYAHTHKHTHSSVGTGLYTSDTYSSHIYIEVYVIWKCNGTIELLTRINIIAYTNRIISFDNTQGKKGVR